MRRLKSLLLTSIATAGLSTMTALAAETVDLGYIGAAIGFLDLKGLAFYPDGNGNIVMIIGDSTDFAKDLNDKGMVIGDPTLQMLTGEGKIEATFTVAELHDVLVTAGFKLNSAITQADLADFVTAFDSATNDSATAADIVTSHRTTIKGADAMDPNIVEHKVVTGSLHSLKSRSTAASTWMVKQTDDTLKNVSTVFQSDFLGADRSLASGIA